MYDSSLKVQRMISRRRFFKNVSATSIAVALQPKFQGLLAQEQNGFYQNPIMGGDHPDASPIRVGADFYLTHSSFDYAPGLLIWHSKDLVNWRPVAAALHRYYGSTTGISTSTFRLTVGSMWCMPLTLLTHGASRSILG